MISVAAVSLIDTFFNSKLNKYYTKDFLVKLDKISYSHDVMVIAPNIVTKTGYHQNPHCVNRVSKFRKLGYYLYFSNYYLGKMIYSFWQLMIDIRGRRDNPLFQKEMYIYSGIGACYILTENFFNHYSKLDDRVFMWGEEALLAGQVAAANGKMLYHPDLIVHHEENASVKNIPWRATYNITRESYKIYKDYL